MEFCDACRREKYIGLCYGPPGVGKTLSARHYAQWHLFESAYSPRPRQQPLAPASLAAIRACRTVVYTPPVANSPNILKKEIGKARCDFDMRVEEALSCGKTTHPVTDLADYCHLLIVDEADRLRTPGLEQLRDIYDRGTLGLVLIGMPGLEKRLARYPQFFSRVGFAHRYQCLSESEVHFLLATTGKGWVWPGAKRTSPTRKRWPPSSGSPAATFACSTVCSRKSSACCRSTTYRPSRRKWWKPPENVS